MDIQERLEFSVKHSHYKVLMPEIRQFSDVFKRFEIISDEQLSQRVFSKTPSTYSHEWKVDELLKNFKRRKGTGIARLMTFCSVRDVMNEKSWNLDVWPRANVIELVNKQMMLSDGYRINFEIIIRADGVALICAHYNMISGSRWFGYVDSSTIPGKP